MLYLKALTELRDRQSIRRRESFNGQQCFVLLRIERGVGPKEVSTEAEKFAQEIAKLGQGFEVVGAEMAH